MTAQTRKTLVGKVDSQVLAFTIGKDPVLDGALAEVDCIGSAAHATMLAGLDVGGGPVLSGEELAATIVALREIIGTVRAGKFKITAADQDVHLAVERMLSAKLGEVGRRIHTARSRNDQVATDLRLYAKTELLCWGSPGGMRRCRWWGGPTCSPRCPARSGYGRRPMPRACWTIWR